MFRFPVRAASWACVAWIMSGVPAGAEVLVSAASSLTEVMTAVAARFEAQTGERVILNFGASNTLVRQIAAGARVDVFVSADEAQMDRLGPDVAPGSRVDLLANQLAIAVPRGGAPVTSPRGLLDPRVRRIAIGDPDAVPAGVYAKRFLESLGLWAGLQPKLVPTGNVRLALAAVESGAADAAIVYVTDVAIARGATLAFAVPVADGPAIRYPAAIVTNSRNRSGAARFLAFLQGDEAREVFTAAGFSMAGGRRP